MRTKKESVEISKDHFLDPADIEKREFGKTLKDRAAVLDLTPRQTFLRPSLMLTEKQLFIYQATPLTNKLYIEVVAKKAEDGRASFADWL